MPLDPTKREEIRRIFEEFLANRAQTVRQLKIKDLDINPFLVRVLSHQLALHDSTSIVRWMVGQRLERGAVTSFGKALEKAAKAFSEGTGVEGADVLKTKEGRRYHIQVKSGPNTVPKDMGVRIAELLRSAQRRNRGSVALYAMCYGKPRRVSSIVKNYVQQKGGVDWLSGRDFWAFISDEPGCVEEIFDIAAGVGSSFKDGRGRSLSDIIADKERDLVAEFDETYGASGENMWRNILRENT